MRVRSLTGNLDAIAFFSVFNAIAPKFREWEHNLIN
jgi:hypothetical protein